MVINCNFFQITGVSTGLLISSLNHDENIALSMVTIIVFSMLVVTGVFWLMESMPTLSKNVFMLLPLSIPNFSFRLVVSKGW